MRMKGLAAFCVICIIFTLGCESHSVHPKFEVGDFVTIKIADSKGQIIDRTCISSKRIYYTIKFVDGDLQLQTKTFIEFELDEYPSMKEK